MTPTAPTREPSIASAIELMDAFAERTGLTSDREPRRYLWTDAFAVCNYLGLARATGDERHLDLALQLIDQVHHTLGRHRDDDPRQGWLSGLDGEEAEEHPTRGGLRIGKKLPERGAGKRFDDRLEWERDGQYFHYLTKWMVALDLTARATGERRFDRWARELAETAHDAFAHESPRGPVMVWKMSIDLSRPLVDSMGHHDPLDGLVTYRQLAVAARRFEEEAEPALEDEIEDFAVMLQGRQLATTDPLGLGGLLIDADRVAQLMERDAFVDGTLLERLLRASRQGLELAATDADLALPASRRLAFRELGLAIGLRAVARLAERAAAGKLPSAADEARPTIEELRRFLPLGERIVGFWFEPDHRRELTWLEHRDINDVMLATALVPEGCLVLVDRDR